jgi:hypothetical protein
MDGCGWDGMGRKQIWGGCREGWPRQQIGCNQGTASRQQHVSSTAAGATATTVLCQCIMPAKLTHFHAQATQPADEDVAGGHAPHALLAVHSQLRAGVGQLQGHGSWL